MPHAQSPMPPACIVPRKAYTKRAHRNVIVWNLPVDVTGGLTHEWLQNLNIHSPIQKPRVYGNRPRKAGKGLGQDGGIVGKVADTSIRLHANEESEKDDKAREDEDGDTWASKPYGPHPQPDVFAFVSYDSAEKAEQAVDTIRALRGEEALWLGRRIWAMTESERSARLDLEKLIDKSKDHRTLRKRSLSLDGGEPEDQGCTQRPRRTQSLSSDDSRVLGRPTISWSFHHRPHG